MPSNNSLKLSIEEVDAKCDAINDKLPIFKDEIKEEL